MPAETPAPQEAPMVPQSAAGRQPVVGYVLKMYPRFSETFIVSEILAREAQGEKIVIFSLRPTTDTRFHPELARVQAPVVHVERPSSAHRWWQVWQRGEADGLAGGLSDALPELLRAGHDDAGQAVTLARLAREHGVTHLHAHFASVATTVARLAGLIAGLPYSFTAHAKDIFHESVDEAELGRKLAGAHHAITISEYNLADLRRRFPASAARLTLVRNGLELERFPYRPARPEDGGRRLLAVGRLVEKKGFGLLVESVARLRDAGIDVSADIAGDGPLHAELQALIARYRLADRVRLLGPRTQAEILELLGSHDVFVAPFVVGRDGNADGLPTVLLEAMARGIRCVAADVTAVGEVVRTGETGWLVPSGDVPALTAAIGEAIRPDPEHRTLTGNARRLVEELFDSRRQAAALRALVAQPAAPRGPAAPADPITAEAAPVSAIVHSAAPAPVSTASPVPSASAVAAGDSGSPLPEHTGTAGLLAGAEEDQDDSEPLPGRPGEGLPAMPMPVRAARSFAARDLRPVPATTAASAASTASEAPAASSAPTASAAPTERTHR
ncbi:glycosyltransferase family 4 protein [Sediminivirga luteola]|nr:glycosyltransferase [Sediminivirga luteola]